MLKVEFYPSDQLRQLIYELNFQNLLTLGSEFMSKNLQNPHDPEFMIVGYCILSKLKKDYKEPKAL